MSTRTASVLATILSIFLLLIFTVLAMLAGGTLSLPAIFISIPLTGIQ